MKTFKNYLDFLWVTARFLVVAVLPPVLLIIGIAYLLAFLSDVVFIALWLLMLFFFVVTVFSIVIVYVNKMVGFKWVEEFFDKLSEFAGR